MIEEYQRLGMNIMDALDNTKTWSRDPGDSEIEIESGQAVPQRAASDVASQNDNALGALQTMMAGTVRG